MWPWLNRRILPQLRHGLAGHVVVAWGGHVAAVVLGLVLTVLVARALGPEGRGIYAVLMTAVALAGQVAVGGLDYVLRRTVPTLTAPQQQPALRRLLAVALAVPMALGSMLAVLVAAGLWHAYAGLQLQWVVLAVAGVPLAGASMALVMVLVARQRSMGLALYYTVPKCVAVVAALGLYAVGGLSLTALLVLNTLAYGLALGVVVAQLPRPQWVGVQRASLTRALRHLGVHGLVGWLAVVAQLVMTKADVALLAWWHGYAAAGVYSLAAILGDVVLAPIQMAGMLLAGRMVSGQTLAARVLKLAPLVALVAAGCAAGAAGVLAYAAGPVFGAGFAGLAHVVLALAPALAALAAYLWLHPAAAAVAPARAVPLAPLVGCCVSMGLNLWLIPAGGALGACLAAAMAYGVAALVAAGVLAKYQTRPV